MKAPNTAKTLIAICYLTMAFGLALPAHSFLTNGLVAYYPFNGNANDASGNGNNGTILGATLSTNQLGTSNRSYNFAPPAAVVVPASPSLNVYSEFSVTGWFYATNLPGPVACLVGKGGGAASETQWLVRIAGPNLTFFCNIGEIVPPTRCASNKWQQFVVTCDQSNTLVNMYLDGTNFYKGAMPGLGIASSPYSIPLYIGNQDGYNNGFSGNIDDIRIYNRVLSSNEVQQLYAYESPPTVSLLEAVEPSFANLVVGGEYQLQVSSNLTTWTNEGAVFTATGTTMVYPQFFMVSNWNQNFYRVETVP